MKLQYHNAILFDARVGTRARIYCITQRKGRPNERESIFGAPNSIASVFQGSRDVHVLF